MGEHWSQENIHPKLHVFAALFLISINDTPFKAAVHTSKSSVTSADGALPFIESFSAPSNPDPLRNTLQDHEGAF